MTSSGGGGHLVAAKNLQETLLEQADVDFEDLESVLNSQGHVLTAEAKAQAEAAIQHVRGGKPPLEMLDLMESECTTVFGVALGDWMSEQWNRRQRAGDIAGLKQLVAQQPWTQSIFGQSCRTYMTAVCDGMNSHGLPALHHSAIAAAISVGRLQFQSAGGLVHDRSADHRGSAFLSAIETS